MKWLAHRSRAPIGVDMGGRHVKAAQFNRSSASWRVRAAGTAARTELKTVIDREEVRLLCDLLAANGFRGRSIVLAVPSDKLLTGIMELPPRNSGAPIDHLAKLELSRMHNCDPASFEVACWELPRPARAANTTFVMATGCMHDDANALLDVFEAEGLRVEGLESHAWAVARACRTLLEGVTGIGGILDLGWTSARLVLLYGGAVVYERRLARGALEPLVASLGDDLEVGPEAGERLLRTRGLQRSQSAGEPGPQLGKLRAGVAAYFTAMMEEMRIPLSYLANQYPDAALERLLLVGGGAQIPGLKDHLTSGLQWQTEVALPTKLAGCPTSFDEEFGPALAVAMGLGQFEGR